MYLCDYSLDNLSLMALTISTGFVVDDAIVVTENVCATSKQNGYGWALRWVLRHRIIMTFVMLGTVAVTVWLYRIIPSNIAVSP